MSKTTKKQNDTINILNGLIKLRIAPSPIHGVGVFAMRNIKKGTKLYTTMFPQGFKIPFGSFGKLLPEVAQLIKERWPRVSENEGFMYPDTLLQAYLNHSDTPNYDALLDITLCDIMAGEEITESYFDIPNYEKIYPFLEKNA